MKDSIDIPAIQSSMKTQGIELWILTDFQNRDPISYRVTGLDPAPFTSRRWFYLIPASGDPVRLAHLVEPVKLDSLPGMLFHYGSYEELLRVLHELVARFANCIPQRITSGSPNGPGSVKRSPALLRAAMNYSPMGEIPAVSTADAGTVELVRSMGIEVVSSADLVQEFEALLDEEALSSHREAGILVHSVREEAFALIDRSIRNGKPVSEFEVQSFIMRRFADTGLVCGNERPVVAVGAHAANPHFQPTAADSTPLNPGSMFLIDMWAKLDRPGSIYYDITWCGYAPAGPADPGPPEYLSIWSTATRARDAALDLVKSRFAADEPITGCEVDEAARKVITGAGYGDFFIHRTGHSIGDAVHGRGANMDSLETKDRRKILKGACFSIEPGIYIPGKMGVRTEIDVCVTPDGTIEVVGPVQKDLVICG